MAKEGNKKLTWVLSIIILVLALAVVLLIYNNSESASLSPRSIGGGTTNSDDIFAMAMAVAATSTCTGECTCPNGDSKSCSAECDNCDGFQCHCLDDAAGNCYTTISGCDSATLSVSKRMLRSIGADSF